MIWTLFEYLATLVEYAIYADFMVRFLPPKNKKRQVIYFLLIWTVNVGITLVFNHFMSFEGALGIIRISVNLIIAWALLNGSYFEKIFAALILDIAALMISFLSLKILGSITDRTVEEMIVCRDIIRLLNLFITKALLFAVTRFLLRIKGDKQYRFFTGEWITIGITFVLTVFIGYGIFQLELNYGLSSDDKISINIGVGLVLINILVYILMKRISAKNNENTKLIIDGMQTKMYQLQMEDAEKQLLEIKKIRHDMNNHLQCIKTLMDNKNYEKADEYIQDIIENKINFGINSVNTGNRVIDIITNTKMITCRNENITVVVYASEIETDIDDVDMCSLLGNIFDNAIDACRKVRAAREIHFEISRKKEYINIIMKNTIRRSVLKNNSELKTTKARKEIHGYGLRAVSDIVKKYDGMLEFFEKNNFFIVDIWLPWKKGAN